MFSRAKESLTGLVASDWVSKGWRIYWILQYSTKRGFSGHYWLANTHGFSGYYRVARPQGFSGYNISSSYICYLFPNIIGQSQSPALLVLFGYNVSICK